MRRYVFVVVSGEDGGMMGLAVVGAVMTSSFSSKLETIVSGKSASSLPEGWLESVRENPKELSLLQNS